MYAQLWCGLLDRAPIWYCLPTFQSLQTGFVSERLCCYHQLTLYSSKDGRKKRKQCTWQPRTTSDGTDEMISCQLTSVLTVTDSLGWRASVIANAVIAHLCREKNWSGPTWAVPRGCSLPLPPWLHERVAWVQPKVDQIGFKMDNNLIFEVLKDKNGGRGGAILRNATRPVTFTRLVNLALTLPPWGLSVEPECVTTLAPVATTSEPCQSPLLVSHTLIWKVES